MQTLWNFAAFNGIGYAPDHLVPYLSKLAKWQKTGDVHFCDPLVPLKKKSEHDPAERLKSYFGESSGKPYDTIGYTTNQLAEAAGYRLRWSVGPYFLKIDGEQWNQDAPLPKTNPDDFLFWFCCSHWSGNGGNLRLIPQDSEPVEIAYRSGHQAAMAYNMPHVLTAMTLSTVSRKLGGGLDPYYCLYGQLQEIKGDKKDL